VEPYVIAADVYAIPPHTGRGGWTWYTGSASWMYRLILESLLGMKQEKNKLHFTPCLPADWKGFTIHYRYRETAYHIMVQQLADTQDEKGSVSVDDVLQMDNYITLVDDHTDHWAVVRIIRTEVKAP
jgi:cellobiose phosphorylase